MKVTAVPFEQPAGSFLIAVMRASDVIRIARVHPRTYDPTTKISVGGVQRPESAARIAEIAKYSNTLDAAFPTPILLALDPETYAVTPDGLEIRDGCEADVVDGQHRLSGLRDSGAQERFQLPVVFILDATEEQKALLFATINGKQTKVPASLIYDLFGVTSSRSPEKSCHEIARAMNQSPESPWYGKLKMLGKKSIGGEEVLSQGTFVKELLRLVSPDPMKDRDAIRRGAPPPAHPEVPLNEYFLQDKDAVILRVLTNVFQAAKQTWPTEWEDPQAYILTKSVGFTGIMRSLPPLIRAGKRQNSLAVEFFARMFSATKQRLEQERIELTNAHFSAGAGATKLRTLILGATNLEADGGVPGTNVAL